LAHSRSALKRWRQALVARDRNRADKGRTRTLLTRALNALDDGADAAEGAVKAAVSALDKAAQKGVIHKNAAARGKARLLKRFNLAQASAVANAASAPAAEKPAAAPPKKAPAAKAAKPAASKAKATPKAAAEKKPAPRSRTPKA
jgi:small subunit ribosomal protein S20